MSQWVLKGLRTGIKTTVYPDRPETAAGVSPGRPRAATFASVDEAQAVATLCPANALSAAGANVSVRQGYCVHCSRCRRADGPGLDWEEGYEWAAQSGGADSFRAELDDAFHRSLHIRFLDAGACGACMSEARQLNNPYYNMHRLGFFMTPTPRNADVLLVAGPVSDAMRLPLCKTYDAMPAPKRVVAIGACALSGGVFGPSFAAAAGVAEVISVDVTVPGCPPPPLAIVHALLVVVRRKPPAPLVTSASDSGGATS